MPTFILLTEACLVTYVTTAVLNNCYSEVMAYIALVTLIGLDSLMCMDAQATPTNDTEYSCHIHVNRTSYF